MVSVKDCVCVREREATRKSHTFLTNVYLSPFVVVVVVVAAVSLSHFLNSSSSLFSFFLNSFAKKIFSWLFFALKGISCSLSSHFTSSLAFFTQTLFVWLCLSLSLILLKLEVYLTFFIFQNYWFSNSPKSNLSWRWNILDTIFLHFQSFKYVKKLLFTFLILIFLMKCFKM